MDIRTAKRGSDKPQAAEPPVLQTSEKTTPNIPHVADDGSFVAPLPDYDGDVVIGQYMSYLKENDVSEDDIRSVLEAIVTSGSVAWDFKLLDSIPVVFQLRPSWVNDVILETIDNETSDNEKVSMLRYNNLVAVCNLAASMTQFRDEKYVISSRDDFLAAKKRVEALPYVIQGALVNKLAVFDRTVAVAMSDWAVKNFMKPRKDSSARS